MGSSRGMRKHRSPFFALCATYIVLHRYPRPLRLSPPQILYPEATQGSVPDPTTSLPLEKSGGRSKDSLR